MDIQALETERASLIDSFWALRHSMSAEAKMIHHNRIAEIDSLLTTLKYNLMTAEERIGHWTQTLYRLMRSSGESGLDEISTFSISLLDKLRQADPQIDALMPFILMNISKMWMVNSSTFFAQVNKQMGTQYSNNINGNSA